MIVKLIAKNGESIFSEISDLKLCQKSLYFVPVRTDNCGGTKEVRDCFVRAELMTGDGTVLAEYERGDTLTPVVVKHGGIKEVYPWYENTAETIGRILG